MNQHLCKNCGNYFQGKYCNNCGEKRYEDHDKKISHFFEEGFHFITHFDGTFFKTIKTMIFKPGKLSYDYCNGIRKSYFKPLSLFLLLVVIYLLFPVFEGLNQKLFYHLQNNLYSGFATKRVKEVMEQKHLSFDQVSELFHHTAEKASKFLLILINPLLALFFWAFLFKKRKYFFDSLIFATEINSVYIIWGFLITPLITYIFENIFHFITRRYLDLSDSMISPIIYSYVLVYTGIGIKRFYAVTTWQSIRLTLLFFLVHVFIVHYLYKFILFVFTIYQI